VLFCINYIPYMLTMFSQGPSYILYYMRIVINRDQSVTQLGGRLVWAYREPFTCIRKHALDGNAH